MLDQMTITKLHELKLSAMAEAFRQQPRTRLMPDFLLKSGLD